VVKVGNFRSGENELYYSCGIPPRRTNDVGIIFVHAADGNRLGPHRMFVEAANRLNVLGYPTLRFDLAGCGDSTGAASDNDITADVSDVISAVRFFVTEANLQGVVLFGISRGARVCYTAMVQHRLPLNGMILLSTPISSGRAALKSFGSRLSEYVCKLKDPEYLRKFLSGRASIAQIRQTLLTALRLRCRYTGTEKKAFTSKCAVLFIYGGYDPIAAESSRYYTGRCRENDVPYDCHVISGANHSFFHYKWKEEIFDVSRQWLERILKQVPR